MLWNVHSSAMPHVGVLLGEQDGQEDPSVVRANRAVGEGVAEFVQGAEPEQVLQKGEVGEGRLARLDPLGRPPFGRDVPWLEPDMEPAADEADLEVSRVPRLGRRREAPFQDGSDLADEGGQVRYADIPGIRPTGLG